MVLNGETEIIVEIYSRPTAFVQYLIPLYGFGTNGLFFVTFKKNACIFQKSMILAP
jgi:hypothetical protein